MKPGEPAAWVEVYPELFDWISETGLPKGFEDARNVFAERISQSEVSHQSSRVRDYLQRLAVADRRLEIEELHLVLDLAEAACVIHGIGLLEDSVLKDQIEELLFDITRQHRDWLSYEMGRKSRKWLADYWPFRDLLSQPAKSRL